MPRPPCPRHIAHQPPSTYFKPAGIPLRDLKEISLAADEMEAVRLADERDLYNIDAAKLMGVSRQTFDRILRKAHNKIASALVNGQALKIENRKPDTPKKTRSRKTSVPPSATSNP